MKRLISMLLLFMIGMHTITAQSSSTIEDFDWLAGKWKYKYAGRERYEVWKRLLMGIH
ncbi:MAG: hypothetical protein WDO16_15425 [Bacteroidota bacterium]